MMTLPRSLLICIALVVSTPLRAEDCPAAPDHAAALDALLMQAQAAESFQQARPLTNEMWALWSDAPNEQAQEILDRGMRKRSSFDLAGAIEDFDRLVAYCPGWAEGYNQRAFVRFIQQDYDAALVDLDRAIGLAPRHVAALAGRALTLMATGRTDEGQADLRRALDLHPWLPERAHLIPEDTGTDL